MHHMFASTLLVAAATAANVAIADDFRVPTGVWEITSSSSMSLLPQVQTQTQRECISANNNDPVSMMAEQPGCELLDRQVESQTLRWRMRCSMEQGEAIAEGRFTLNGDSAHGEMVMEMSMQSMPVTMEMQWSGKRMGDC